MTSSLQGTTSPATRAEPVFDRAGTLARLGGDEELFAELVRYFREDCVQLRRRLETALADGDAKAAEVAAHAIKGLCLNFGAVDAVAAASSVEACAREGNLADVRRLLPFLTAKVGALDAALPLTS